MCFSCARSSGHVLIELAGSERRAKQSSNAPDICWPMLANLHRGTGNHHNKWAIIVFNAVPVITYAFGYLVLRGPVLTGSMVLWLAGFGMSICIWFAALVWACTRVRPTMSAAQGAEAAWIRSSANAATHRLPGRNSAG